MEGPQVLLPVHRAELQTHPADAPPLSLLTPSSD